MTEPRHDPGGRSRFALAEGVTGEAVFSPCQRYRHALYRRNGSLLTPNYRTALFVGMNPSTADGEVDDPTCRREQGFAWREGCRYYVKANVMDYRATAPARLLEPDIVPRSAANLEWIERLATLARADGGFAVAAWGMLPKPLRRYADEALAVLRQTGVTIYCLGTTRDGSPRHPLYQPATAPLRPFRGGAP